jgi:hypothetical protein
LTGRGPDKTEYTQISFQLARCRAFTTFALDQEQADSVVRDLDALGQDQRPGLRIGVLVVLHNQDGRSAAFRQAVQAALASLQRAGRARQVHLWSRELLLRDAFDAMVERLSEAVRQRSAACAPAPGDIEPHGDLRGRAGRRGEEAGGALLIGVGREGERPAGYRVI